jgi:hypothetical protein
VSAEVGASSAGNPLWLGRIATYCVKRPDATLRAALAVAIPGRTVRASNVTDRLLREVSATSMGAPSEDAGRLWEQRCTSRPEMHSTEVAASVSPGVWSRPICPSPSFLRIAVCQHALGDLRCALWRRFLVASVRKAHRLAGAVIECRLIRPTDGEVDDGFVGAIKPPDPPVTALAVCWRRWRRVPAGAPEVLTRGRTRSYYL